MACYNLMPVFEGFLLAYHNSRSENIWLLAGKKLDQWWGCHLLWPLDISIDTAFPLYWWNT
jgi:hypothetical protein